MSVPKNRFASLRIDYLLERVSPGKARVWTGEVGELGCLGCFIPPQDLRCWWFQPNFGD